MRSLLRTSLFTLAAAALLVGGVWWRASTSRERLERELADLRAETERLLARKDAMIERLGRDRRVAHVEIVDQTWTPEGEVESTAVLFVELDESGRELGRRTYTVPGDVVFIDAWTAKFDPTEVASGNPLRGRTLVLLRRIYSDRQAPRDGQPIDTPGAVPTGYVGTDMSRFERLVWDRFWEIATDAETARAMGVRVAQGEAVYKPVREGQRYELLVDAAGGINLRPLPPGDTRVSRGSDSGRP